MGEQQGLEAYQSYQHRVLHNVAQIEASAPPPDIVAQTIWQAAHDNSDRLRYSVGQQVPLLLFLNRLLPHSWFRQIIKTTLEKPNK